MTGSPLRRWRFRQLIRHNLNINGISPLLPTSNKVVSSINRCCPHSIGKSAARGRVADKNKTKTVYFDRSALPCRPQGHVRQARFCPEPTGISLAQSPKFLGFKDQFVQTEIPLTRTSAECQLPRPASPAPRARPQTQHTASIPPRDQSDPRRP